MKKRGSTEMWALSYNKDVILYRNVRRCWVCNGNGYGTAIMLMVSANFAQKLSAFLFHLITRSDRMKESTTIRGGRKNG